MHTNTQVLKNKHRYWCVHILIQGHMCTYAQIQVQAQSSKHIGTCAIVCTHVHTDIHAHKHRQTCIHMHPCIFTDIIHMYTSIGTYYVYDKIRHTAYKDLRENIKHANKYSQIHIHTNT